MSERRHSHVINVSEVEPRVASKGKKFGSSARSLGRNTNATKLGCTHFTVEPGRAGFPRHFHCFIDEAIYVLAGEGTLTIGDATVHLRAGDYVNLPAGPDHAHQLVNTGKHPLEYLAMSTLSGGDVVEYPDSGKLAVRVGPSYERMIGGEVWRMNIARPGASLDYYDGEDTGE